MSIKIEDEIGRLGHLRNAAAAIVDYVRSVSKGSEFQPYTEWTLEPDKHFDTAIDPLNRLP